MRLQEGFPLACILTAKSVLALAPQNGLIGFPANAYDPFCATSCLRSFASLMLDCSNTTGDMLGMMVMTTSTECYASNTPFLTSVAWCTHVKCAGLDLAPSELESWWETVVTGQQAAGVSTVPPKWSYQESLAQVAKPPTLQLAAADTDLNTTSLVSEAVYLGQWNALTCTWQESATENQFGYDNRDLAPFRRTRITFN